MSETIGKMHETAVNQQPPNYVLQQAYAQQQGIKAESESERTGKAWGVGITRILNEAEDRGRAKGVQSCDAELSKLRAEVNVLRAKSSFSLNALEQIELQRLRMFERSILKILI